MSFPTWNSDPSWNKITSSYFRDNIDLSGNFIIRNGTIRSPANEIQFDDTFGFINFTNASFFGQLKNTYNSVEYDVGLQCEKADSAVEDIATLSPIVSDTAFKCTNFYYDQSSNSTVWSGLLTCPIASIASTAIANTTRFIEGTGNQNVGGIKRFTSNIRIDAGMQLSAGTITLTNADLQKIAFLNTATSNIQTQINTLTTNSVSLSASNVFTGSTNQFSNTLRLDGALNLNANALVVPNTTLQKIQYLSTVSSDVQTQINTLTTNSVSLSASNVFTGATNQFSNTLRLDGALNLNANALVVPNTTLQKIQYLSTVSSDVQTQINNINGVSLSASNVFTGATNQFSNSIRLDGTLVLNANTLTLTNDNLTRIQHLSGVSSSVSTSITNINTSVSTLNTKTTKMSYMSVGGVNTTTILDGLISQTFSFTGTINNISTATFGYISGLTSSAQSQITTLATKLTNTSYSGTTTTISNSLVFTGTLNTITTTVFGYLSGVSSSIQNQLNTLSTNLATTTTSANEAKQRTTDIEFSDIGGNQTTISNKCVLDGEVVFNTDLNNITPTTFGYLANCSSNIQTQLDSKLTVIPGTIFQHSAGTLQEFFPYKFLLCNGQSVSRTEYANLFQWIGTSFGSVNSSSFNVPDYRCCFLRMYSSTTRVVNGVNYATNAINTIQPDSLEAHVHSSNLTGTYLNSTTTNGTHFTAGANRYNTTSFPEFTGGVSSSHRTSTETRPLNYSVYFYISC
jgi:microcystin-dependent protein